MPKRENPGGYIGEAMQAAKPVRRPRPFKAVVGYGNTQTHAECFEDNKPRRRYAIIYGGDSFVMKAKPAREFAAWLIRAASWIEEQP